MLRLTRMRLISQIPSKMVVADTYMVWPRSDQLCFDLIHQARPEYKWMIVYWNDPRTKETLVDMNGVEIPIEPEPTEIADSNLILIGGSSPNPYTKKYFVDTGIITVDETKQIMKGPGVYANGKRCITSVQRPNGTVVTGIFGWLAIDTFYATQDYLGAGGLGGILQIAVPVVAFIGGLAVSKVL